ncbi:MAG: hypothetical protein JJT96_07545 [Opitutales bacterium]|nr:hypothetical protein [Opitutales bacterium]
MPTTERLPVTPADCPGNAAIRRRYPIDRATWIWHPDNRAGERSFVRFTLAFATQEKTALTFDVSADQRFILQLDGQEVGRGPDRSELGGWAFHRYRVHPKPGKHFLRALVWWLPSDERPLAQVSAFPAFAVAGLDHADALLSTGKAPWRASTVNGWSCLPKNPLLCYHVIGSGFHVEGTQPEGSPTEPVTVACGGDSLHGVVHTPWRCEPSPLPEQARTLFAGGRICWTQNDHHLQLAKDEPRAGWEPLVVGGPITIAPSSEVQILWDFETYVCGYPRLQLDGGEGSRIGIEWAEALYNEFPPTAHTPKGHRGEVAGKHWLGFGDTIDHPGGSATYEVPWWRSGRYLRLVIRTAKEPLLLRDVRPLHTGHPFTRRWSFTCDDDLAGILELCESGLRHCVHETFIDCPYYEQMQYVGDTRTQALTWLVATGDRRPVQRALELFDRSRWVNGFVAERCPTDQLQMSATYSLIQPLILKDYAWWTDDAATVRRLLPGTRAMLECALACLDEDHLPSKLPGWLFVDWVARPDWAEGTPGGMNGELSAPVALHLPLALLAMASLESHFGESLLAERWRDWAEKTFHAIEKRFFHPGRALFADDAGSTRWSEHAQALALAAAPLVSAERRPTLLEALLAPAADLAPASVYFSYHVHEAIVEAGLGDALRARFAFWKNLLADGFVTTVEAPEPARSDCHGWGAHPLYHCLTGLAGIRPAAPGFRRVHIAPLPGSLTFLRASVPHPQGEVSLHLRNQADGVCIQISTPVEGDFLWKGEKHALGKGENRIHLPSR